MKIVAAAIQMPARPGALQENLDRADGLLARAKAAGAMLAVLPELFNTGYALVPDYAPIAEPADGPTVTALSARCREWGMTIAAGFVERDGADIYDSLALCLPSGRTVVYRKRNLVFWEGFRFRPGRDEVIVETPFGRVGLAICADMIYRRVWSAFRGRVDVAVIAAAWPDFECRRKGRRHWLMGNVGPLAQTIPSKVAADLGIPVVFANQCGPTLTKIPLLGLRITETITDEFAGGSCVADGLHAPPARAGRDEAVVLSEITIHSPRGPRAWRSTSRSGSEASSSVSGRDG